LSKALLDTNKTIERQILDKRKVYCCRDTFCEEQKTMKKQLALLLNFEFDYGYAIDKFATSIGRLEGNDCVIPNDCLVSKQHAYILYSEGEFLIQDLGSKNGTYINGRRLEPWHLMPLVNGDEIIIGTSLLTFECLEEPTIKGPDTVWDLDAFSASLPFKEHHVA
jgi:hypothetical protein